MARPTQATIDINALLHNFTVAKNFAGNTQLIAVVKANAYGHGATEVALALKAADMLGVASLEEAVELRLAGIERPILLLSGFHQTEDLVELQRLELDVVVHSQQQINALIGTPLPAGLNVWLKMDTGMHRLGFAPEQMGDAFAQLQESTNVANLRLLSHFACSDNLNSPATNEQLALFNRCTSGLAAEASLCNSASLISHPAAHKQWVRPGIMLYGGNPFCDDHEVSATLKPVMTLHSKIIAIRQISTGESVGYGGRWVAQRDSIIGTVAVGYGDGYPRHAPSGTPVLVKGQLAPLVGTVSMDLIGVDLTDIPMAKVGDKAILWGEGLPVEQIARHVGTINYELLTGVSKRVPRQYLLPS